MNTFDASFHCPTCHEQYAYCGCPNEDSGPFSASRSCMNCWGDFPVLFTYGGDNFERCASCHNEARIHYLPGGVLFEAEEGDYLY